MPGTNSNASKLIIGLAQISPVWLDRESTLDKIIDYTQKASESKCDLVVFGEAVLPGYPFWIEPTGGASFNSPVQKAIHAHYMENAVVIERGDLDKLCKNVAQLKVAAIVGTIERASDRGGHSLYCSLVYINSDGKICNVHRKLMPTYEERLTWSPGDGHGLRVHKIGAFTMGALNCWENWMPLPRAALYGMGEDLHVAIWPGSKRNTDDITRFIAKESRSFVVSVSGFMRKTDFPKDTPHLDKILANCDDILADGGSCLAGPDGEWIVEPYTGEEKLVVAEIDHKRVFEERQNFDPVGHYSRPDVTKLVVNRKRQSTIELLDDE